MSETVRPNLLRTGNMVEYLCPRCNVDVDVPDIDKMPTITTCPCGQRIEWKKRDVVEED